MTCASYPKVNRLSCILKKFKCFWYALLFWFASEFKSAQYPNVWVMPTDCLCVTFRCTLSCRLSEFSHSPRAGSASFSPPPTTVPPALFLHHEALGGISSTVTQSLCNDLDSKFSLCAAGAPQGFVSCCMTPELHTM